MPFSSTLVASGVAGVGAGAAVIGNQVAFGELDKGFRRTGELDPSKSLEVESWRNAATALTVTSLGLGLVGGGLFLWSLSLEDGEVGLPW